MSEERVLLVDASVFITLAEVGVLDALFDSSGAVVVPMQVWNEITSEPAASRLSDARDSESLRVCDTAPPFLVNAAEHLGRDLSLEAITETDHETAEGDLGLLGRALSIRAGAGSDESREHPIVVSDDKPLRQTCKALSIPVSGSIGVLIRAVERGDLDASEAKATLEAMDEVGARLSASLYRTAERLIDDVAAE